MNQLQAALIQKGYHCGEEETEDFVFGHDTESALMTFQVWALASDMVDLQGSVITSCF